MSDLNKCGYCGYAFPAVEEACTRCGTQVDCDCNCHGGGTCVGDATTSGAACCSRIGESLDDFSGASLQTTIDFEEDLIDHSKDAVHQMDWEPFEGL